MRMVIVWLAVLISYLLFVVVVVVVIFVSGKFLLWAFWML
jgi:hypothetical protein